MLVAWASALLPDDDLCPIWKKGEGREKENRNIYLRQTEKSNLSFACQGTGKGPGARLALTRLNLLDCASSLAAGASDLALVPGNPRLGISDRAVEYYIRFTSVASWSILALGVVGTSVAGRSVPCLRLSRALGKQPSERHLSASKLIMHGEFIIIHTACSTCSEPLVAKSTKL